MVEMEWKPPGTEAKKMDKIIKGEHRPRRDEFLIKESQETPSREETGESPERKCGLLPLLHNILTSLRQEPNSIYLAVPRKTTGVPSPLAEGHDVNWKMTDAVPQLEVEAEEIPEGASTLAFVFDVTGSMYDDLVQVIEGASKILETSLKRPKRPLFNFALVPFHDPEIGPVTVTTDPKKFQYELRELYVQGGGDCPEMSIGAIKIALEISLPGSFIYVFTDARSKDYRLTHEVLQLIQQKQSQVVFVLTGDCDDRSHIGYRVYEEIASTSSGQVFHLDKKQVNEVLKWVEEAVQASKVHLLSTDHLEQAVNTWKIPFDPSLKEVTVSLSGPSPMIEIRNPLGKLIKKGFGLNELLNIHNSAKVVNVKEPEAGIWTVKTSSTGRHSVRITGLSTIDFRAGFSRKPTLDFKKTVSRPVQGIPTYVLLNTSGISIPARVDRLELLSISGSSLKTIPVKYYPDRKPYGIWNISDYIPPNEAFFLKVTGYDKDDFPFQRVSSVSFSSIVPDAPKVTMPEKTPGYYLQPGQIPCAIDSLLPFTLSFVRNGVTLGVDQYLKESARVTWDIEEVTLSDEGPYECIAVSSAGTGRAQTFFDVSEPPPVIQVPNNVTVTPGETAVLTCLVVSAVGYNLTWQRNGRDVRLTAPAGMRILANLSLELRSVKFSDAGEYRCVVSNEGGSSTEAVFLTVQEPPKVTVMPKNQSFTEAPKLIVVQSELLVALGDTTVMECKTSGVPPPQVKWFKGDLELKPSTFLIIDPLLGLLKIQETQDLDAGDYTCVAVNDAGRATGRITLDVGSPPVFIQEPTDVSVEIGSNVTLPCYVQGYPEPKIKWRRLDNMPIFSRPFSVSSISQLRTGDLFISNLWASDKGTYICEAENQFGKIQSQTTVTVTGLVAPLIGISPPVTSVIEGQQLTLPCALLAGNPIPERRWIKNSAMLVQNPYITVRSDGSLHIERVRLQDGGEYTCVASNVAGTTNKTTTVDVHVLPTIQHGQQILSTIEGIPVTLPCKASGIPKPSIAWSKKGELISTSSAKFSAGADGSLYVVSPGGEESGEYVCTATNAAGYAKRKVQLTVYVRPRVFGDQRGPSQDKPVEISVLAGEEVTLPCEVKSLPPPIITWAKETQLISPFSPRHTFLPSGSMKITETRVSDSGMYLCVATNIAGNVTQSVKLNVHEPPILEDLEPPYNTPFQERVANQRIAFPCPAKGTPKPTIKWLRNGRELTGQELGISILEDGTLLVIASVTPYDNGEYICVAVNEAGTTERRYNLKVHVPPVIKDKEQVINVSVLVNQPTSLFCEVEGTPSPIIMWYKDDVQVTESSSIQIINNGKILKLFRASPEDAGRYSCKAVNVAGASQKHFNIDVLGAGSPGEVSVVLNQDTTLECQVKGTPFPVIHWFKDGKPLFLEDPNIEILDRGQVLHLKNARRSDKGRYQCTVSNAAGKQAKDIKLTIYIPPSIKGGNVTTEVSALINSVIKLECETRGLPMPAITWYKDGQPVISSSQALYVEKGQFLHIPRAQVTDSAAYKCLVTNVAGSAEKSFHVDVYVPPMIEGDLAAPLNKQVIVAHSLTLECKAAGNPPPVLTWLKDGVPVKVSDNIRIEAGGKKLEITSALEVDRGQYICVATSVAGEKEIKYEVDVLVPPAIEGGDETSYFIVMVNNLLELDCQVTGSPPPTIMWLKDGQLIDERDGFKILLNGRKLVIAQAQVSDTGLYRCVATNTAGDHKKEFEVTVHVPPTIKSSGLSERAVLKYKPIALQCIANGIPNPSITWLKDGQPVNTAQGNLKIQSSGRLLQIAKALMEDAGRYTCVATNAAGETQQLIQLHVHEPPSLEDAGKMLNETVVVNSPVQLESITWYKDNRPLSESSSVTFLNRGQIINIESAQITDAGIYKCVAINSAGATELLYSLQVHVPPSIFGSNDMVAVVVNNLVRLECEARGIPAPSLTWLKDGSPVASFVNGIQVLSGGRILALTSAQISDTGRYTCVAINAAGEKQRDIDLRVYVAPNIMGEEQNVSVLISQAVELLCRSDAIPPPTLTWLKDGRPLLKKPGLSVTENGSVLKIEDAQVQDSGRYTCEATNVAGKTEKNYNVNIWVPPNISGSDEVAQLTVIEGHLISLLCESSGIPPPNLLWKKKGSAVLADSAGRVRILSGGRQLQISIAEKSDAGRYSCMASNVAGTAKKDYSLQVYTRPTISNSGSHPTEVIVTRGKSVSLECEVEGIPQPAVTWMKDGRPLTKGRGMEIMGEGRGVQLKNVHVSDTGRYVCVAMNIAGMTDRKYDLSVHTPPSIIGNHRTPENISVVEKSSVSLNCEASGIPLPSITWLKDGWPVNLSSSLRILSVPPRIMGENAFEDVKVKEKQSVTLTCEVTVSPIIAGVDGDGNPEDVTVILNSPTSLVCEAYSYPPATITWFKNGTPLESNRNIRILPGGRTLQILNAQEDDAGRYACVATNEAGEMIKHYEVKVYIPPIINKGDLLGPGLSPREVKIKPLKSDDHVTIAASGHTLQIKETQISDTGRYTCVASNVAGEDELDFDVNIQVPPSFQKLWEIGNMVDTGRRGEAKDVIINNPISLYCETNAAPAPTLTWYKDGHPLTSSERVLILPGGRVLQIPRAKVEDAGRYVCVAVNEAGEDSLQYDVRVLLPPVIKGANGDLPEEVTVLVNKSVLMECLFSGSPTPRSSWQKDGQPLLEDERHKFLSNGRILQVLNSQITDIGRYVCIAENTAGSAKKYFNLNVHVPPSIIGPNPENLTVVVNNFISLTCEVSGFPPPDLSWLKNEQPIKLNTNALIVPVPPSIKDHGSESLSVVNVREGTSVSLECESNAVPPPVITWYKNGRMLTDSAPLAILADGQMLHIAKAEVSDTGQYVCRAINVAGRDDKNFHLNVYVPPSIEGPENEVTVETVSNPVTLTCDATGLPPPSIAWLKNHKPIAFALLCLDNESLNYFSKVPPNVADAEIPSEVSVLLGENVELVCNANGIPTPLIQWLKDGKPIVNSETERIRVTADGSTLNIYGALPSDMGKYTCVATNPAGEEDRIFNLNVYEPPHINGSEEPIEMSVIVNNPLELTCMASGIPAPKITWMKDGRPLPQMDQMQTLGEVLRISSTQVEDTGRYTCLASSPAGDDDKEYLVRVHVPPNIAGTGEPQDFTVLRNRQVTLECKSDAVPPPVITWLKNGERLQATPRIRILSGGRYLQINNADLGDTANYTCVASNIVGKTTREFILTVNVPPSIKSGPQSLVIHLNKSTLLECFAEGVPAPKITWRKDGAVLSGSHARYSILENGFLHIQSAQVTDSGRYLCMATNAAGTDRRRIDLQVHVPPSIAPGPTNITVTVNVQTTLACEATGIPKPSINWRKNGHLLNVDQNQNSYRLLSSGSLVIISPSVDDTATYECTVTSDAGEDERTVDLTVQVPPSIADEPTDFLVTKHTPTVITCTASGVPFPSIHWMKNGIRLLPRGEGYRILSSGAIEILATQLSHAGRYTCVARNSAGSAHRHVSLHVQEAPVIQPQPSELDVILNNPILLPCEATGTPSPFITWQKEGINVISSGRSHAVLPHGGLQISRAVREDAGTYMCVAQNPAGTALGKIKLNVQVPPVISPHPKEYVTVVDKPIMLPCEADGLPPPDIMWHKDGHVIMESVRQRILSSGALQIAFAQPGDAGQYTCMAANVAGSSSTSTKLTVHVPPRIQSTEVHYTVNENSQAVLPCVADGIPTPAINWKKDNVLLANLLGKYTVEPYGELLLENVVPEDSGTYTCVANNAAGEDTHTISLTVHVLPTFTELPGDVSLNKGEQLRLNCKATGIPLPKLTWTFNNNIIPAHFDSVSGHSELVIERISKEDSGTYVCTAENSVGFVKAIGFVYVKEPPVFKGDYPSNWIEPLGGNAILNCEVKGDPAPTIQWSRRGTDIEISHRIRQLGNGSLAIYGTVNEDAGDYTCVATNEAGVVERSMSLTLQSPPIITLEPVETIINAGSKVILNCQATGEPRPTITWSRQGRSILWDERINVLSNNSLHIAAAQKEDTSEYECVARNLMGSVLVRVPVIVQVDGNWSEWSLWEECTRSCGRGNRTRTRTCNNPSAQHGGRPCDGIAMETIMCNIRPCPVDGKWATWTSWSACSVSCGGGARQRTRDCSDPAPQYGGNKCEGSDVQSDFCNSDSCPTHGNWSPWSGWGICSRTCNGGQMRRYRTCDNPHPSNGGRACGGPDSQIQRCNTDMCPVDGSWGNWHSWSWCSTSCGGGEKTRKRLCNNPIPSKSGRPCPGDATQVSRCNIQVCPGGPQRARGSVIGSINDVEFGIAFLNATVTDSPNSDTRIIHAKITNVPRSLGPAMRKIVSILNPIYWTTAKEIGEAVNGFTLTNAVFKRETQVEFATGEILRMTHVARGLDSDGALLVDIIVSGHVLQLQSPAEVTVKDYTEDYVQTGAGQLYAYSTRLFTIDGISVPYTWNHTVSYDEAQGRMPFLVETLHASSVESDYNQLEETLGFKIHAAISKGERSNQCPSGFALDSVGPFCADEDECATGNPCSHFCHNAMGTYYCSCPKGLTIAADGRTCQDIDECALGGYTCHAGQDCDNTIGSYRCVVRCGIGFRRTSDGLSCQDINECQESSPCHHRCFNAIGSFHCGCEPGYQLKGRKCVDINECRQNVCRPDQHCKNTRGGYKCIDLCPNGMTKAENGTCIDVDECKDGTHQCRYNQICENTRGSYRCVCPRGYRSQGLGRPCLDINECENTDTCQHECKNTFGSYRCICPPGYQLMLNGKTCQDIDECLEQNVRCGPNRMCFNMRGSYRCIETPCPPDYQRDPVSGFCLKNCPPNDLECALSPYALEYKLVSLPFGIAANQDLIRLVAYTQDGVMHPRTTFLMIDEEQTIPFALRDENLKGVVYTIRPLQEPETYRMRVRALSYSANGTVEYQTTFIVYIAVSAYPY
ncbi:hypothetical protein MJG53_011356 [Ovis ammon polii x Ovis aries]|uniref:Uncharacterized protein n=1 Tax=Ovis ammon polii x Ovis aries TaxID=2918886 RepID=A0ACB9UT37_9CETA|nr:hypothetical protein MJG53_011356 [Ovis ammon polii x Ovis aries]